MGRLLAIMVFLLSATLLFADTEVVPTAYDETGLASWYDSDPDGNLTANGERFDPNAMKAAHKSLPFGTVVRVHDLHNHMSVEVTINDRGPYVDGRIIDLTPGAARKIDMHERGISPVGLEILFTPTVPVSNYNRPGDTGWYMIQIGTFANLQRVEQLYAKFHDLGFKPTLEIVRGSLVRLTLRWIREEEKESSMRILESLGFTDVLLRGDVSPLH